VSRRWLAAALVAAAMLVAIHILQASCAAEYGARACEVND